MNQKTGGWKAALIWGGYWVAALLYWEFLLSRAVLEGSFRGYTLGYTLCYGLAVAAIFALLPKKAGFWGNLAVSLVTMVVYGSQMVYSFIFGTLYSLSLVDQGGAALTSFWRETLSTMGANFPWLLALLVPVVVLILLHKVTAKLPGSRLWSLGLAIFSAGAFFLTGMLLKNAGTGLFSDYDYYHSSTIATNQQAERFGLLTALRLELMGDGEAEEEESVYYIPTLPTEAPETQPEATEEDVEPEPTYGYNVMDIDFDQLNTLTDNKKTLAINDYCAQLTGTRQNEYTGFLSDYNLIVLCAESFSTAAIDPEITPTLYKLSQGGFVFENYFNSYPNTTTDGEYSLTQGLWPDFSRNKESSSLYASRNSYLPFTLGNAFLEQRGIQSLGYHNYRGDYYGRDESHPNMGYQMKFMNAGMKFTSYWPASDLEMMEQSVDDYIDQEQFHVYYMTFSGHYMYDTSTNAIAAKNWDAVKDLPYSTKAEKAYLACNIELDKALEYLMNRLEEAGVLDKTAIVLAGDHFPYGLMKNEYSELIGYEIDSITKYRSSLLFWVGGMEEPVTVSDYCCNVDILPTLLNMWGLEYDSRLLAGTDIFSDSTHVAILKDKSWMTDKVWFRADSGEAEYLVPEEEVPEGYVDAMNMLVATRFSISSDILNTAYYNFVFDKGSVYVGRSVWGAI